MIVLARVERVFTGDVVLHLLRPDQVVELTDGAEFVTVELKVDPWNSAPVDWKNE